MKQPVECIHAHLFNEIAEPFVWVLRGEHGRFYHLTRSSDERLWYVLSGLRGRVHVALGGWIWRR